MHFVDCVDYKDAENSVGYFIQGVKIYVFDINLVRAKIKSVEEQ